MRQSELHLTEEDRELIESYRANGRLADTNNIR